jgi:quercetin dioxygenase-like cupin family protein
MQYFQKIAEGVMTLPLLHSLARHPEWWDTDTMRTTFEGTPHSEVHDVLLRFGAADGNDLEAVDFPVMAAVPKAKEMALDLMRLVSGSRLGRMVVTKLEPGKRIAPHADVKGLYSAYYTRYHIVLQGLQGSLFNCGDETVNMLTGDIWWFDAHAEHSLVNNSKDDRVHLLVDVRIDQ